MRSIIEGCFDLLVVTLVGILDKYQYSVYFLCLVHIYLLVKETLVCTVVIYNLLFICIYNAHQVEYRIGLLITL